MFVSWKCSGRQMEGQERIRVWPGGLRVNLPAKHNGPELLWACLPTVLPAAPTVVQSKGHMSARQARAVGSSGTTQGTLGKRHPSSE